MSIKLTQKKFLLSNTVVLSIGDKFVRHHMKTITFNLNISNYSMKVNNAHI